MTCYVHEAIQSQNHCHAFGSQVLDAGQIHAYDEPYILLQDPGGIFFKMVQQTGKQEAAALLQMAKQVSHTLSALCTYL